MSVRRSVVLAAVAAAGGSLAFPLAAEAAYVADYFNGYGSTQISLSGNALNGGQDWSTSWLGATSPQYVPNSTAGLYSAPGYSSLGNLNGTTHGAASASASNEIAYRQFAPMTGTIWLSVSVRLSAASQSALFWLDKTNTGVNGVDRDFLALRPNASVSTAIISYAGTDDNTSTATPMPVGSANLFLARIQMNASGANDNITFWLNPDLSGGLAGLGETVGNTNGPVYVKTGSDAYGTTFDGIGISGDSVANIRFDSIRISDEANAFEFVTTGVPEPTTAGVAAVGLIAAALRRRRTHG
jgi:MYXO-CTERM domain-containing protein